MLLVLCLGVVGLLLLLSELYWRLKRLPSEYTRKFVHITVGSFVAFWILLLPRLEIMVISAAFVGAVLISRHWHLLRAIHSVQRPTWGELCFALAVGLLAYYARSPIIYTVALLHMSLADGLAAIIGTRYGKSNSYQIFGGAKSIVGSITFFVTSILILAGYNFIQAGTFHWWYVAISGTAMILENIAVRGLDNLLVPLFIATGLSFIH